MRSKVFAFLVFFYGFIVSSECTNIAVQQPMIQDIESRLSVLYDFAISSQDFDCMLAIRAFKQAAIESNEVEYIKPEVLQYLIAFGLADDNGLLKADYLIVWRLHKGSSYEE